MKKFLLIIFLIINTCFLFSQNNPSDYSKLISRVRPLPNPFSPTSVQSTIYTVNGFDNFYLGNDNSEPYIAVNPNDPLNMICAYNSPTATASHIYITTDGYNWARTFPSYGAFQPIGDPVMTYDSLGNMYFMEMYEQTSNGPWGGVVLKSTNKGTSWLAAVSAYQLPGGLCDKPWMTCDQSAGPYSNYLYIGWRYFGSPGGMYFVRSTDKGVTWSSPITLSGSQGAYVSVGPNGSIPGGNLYYACTNGGSTIVYRSTNGGATFAQTPAMITFTGPGIICYGRYTVKDCIRTDNFPRMAADNSWTSTRGNLYVVYSANPAGADGADIFLVKSTDYGNTWSTPVKVNDDNTTTDQWMPAVTVDKKTGRIFVMWYDSRNDPTGNLFTEVYGTTSTDGGNTFAPNSKISNANFNPNIMAFGPANDAKYMGDYIGNAGIGITSINAWMDDRVNSSSTSQSFVAYNPDFAFLINPAQKSVGNNDSITVALSVPAIKGFYNDKVKFTATLDSLPTSGTISFSFVNGKDSITTYPDSVYLRVKTIGVVSPTKRYPITITAKGSNGTPVHKRSFGLLVNCNTITVQSNYNGTCSFNINGVSYNNTQQLIFPIGTVVSVQAVSPQGSGGTIYVFKNWSDNGDTTHNVTINNAINLTVFYKTQYLALINSAYGNVIGNTYHDSGAVFTFGVYPRIISLGGGQGMQFRGWDGAGNGAYTSTDSTGLDSIKSIPLNNPLIEIARWTPVAVGIQNISNAVPNKFALYQNYPNPFNPSTTIKFDIAKAGLVKIKVYDILGREITTLVNEVMQPGYYLVPFTVNRFLNINIASGIYYFRITANEFTDIKKMILLK